MAWGRSAGTQVPGQPPLTPPARVAQPQATDLEELEVDEREAAGAQLHLQRAERGEQLQRDDGAQARPHGRHALGVLQLPQPQAPDGRRVDVLVLPPAGARGTPVTVNAEAARGAAPRLAATRPQSRSQQEGPQALLPRCPRPGSPTNSSPASACHPPRSWGFVNKVLLLNTFYPC